MKRKINENVEKIRSSKGVTKVFLASQVGLTPGGYNHIAKGDVEISAERLKVIADALGEEVTVFYDDELTNVVSGKLSKK